MTQGRHPGAILTAPNGVYAGVPFTEGGVQAWVGSVRDFLPQPRVDRSAINTRICFLPLSLTYQNS